MSARYRGNGDIWEEWASERSGFRRVVVSGGGAVGGSLTEGGVGGEVSGGVGGGVGGAAGRL